MSLFAKLSLKYRLMVSFVLTASLAMIGTGIMTWYKKTGTLMDIAEERLMVFRESKGNQLEEAFKTMRGQVKTLAKNRLTIEAMKDFSTSFKTYNSELAELPSEDRIKNAITSYYSNQFGVEFRKQNDEVSPDTSGIIPKLSKTALILQYNYIVENEHPLGSKNLLEKKSDGTKWSAFHSKYHESFAQYLDDYILSEVI